MITAPRYSAHSNLRGLFNPIEHCSVPGQFSEGHSNGVCLAMLLPCFVLFFCLFVFCFFVFFFIGNFFKLRYFHKSVANLDDLQSVGDNGYQNVDQYLQMFVLLMSPYNDQIWNNYYASLYKCDKCGLFLGLYNYYNIQDIRVWNKGHDHVHSLHQFTFS